MKKIIFIVAMVSCMALTACNGSSNDTSKRDVRPAPQAITDSTNADTAATVAPTTMPVATQATPQAPQQAPRPVKPESSTDKLLKQYNEVFVNLVLDKKAGKDIDTKEIEKLKSQLEQLDKNGGLDATQKELLKVTNDAYDQFMKQ